MSVYFIRHQGHIKIGKSVDPWKRLASLQTAHYEPLEMLAIMPGSEDLEHGLHRAFGKYMKRGEWFQENGELLAFIEIVKATFPDAQRNLEQEARQIQAPVSEGRGQSYFDESGYEIITDTRSLELGESTTFRMTHKGHYRNPARSPISFWETQLFYYGGYWIGNKSEDWYTLYDPGLRFEFVNMQHVTITRFGDVHTGKKPRYTSPMTSLEHCLSYALREAIYNRKNTGPWLGVYNDEHYGIVMAVRLVPQEPLVQLDVPEEVIAYWRQYQYKNPLPKGVSIEA